MYDWKKEHAETLKINWTHISIASFFETSANSADPDQTPQFANRMFYQNLTKSEEYHPATLKTEMFRSNW